MPKRVLIVGEIPELVDFSDPSIPPGMSAEKVHAGLNGDRDRLNAMGLDAEILLVDLGDTAADVLATKLSGADYACISLGGGLRTPPKMTELFESLVNVVHQQAPNARLAFSTAPNDTANAILRQVQP